MEAKIYSKEGMVIDGRMDEPQWAEVPAHDGFVRLQKTGGGPAEEKTWFKVLPCEDRVYIGIYCEEPDMEYTKKKVQTCSIYTTDSVELFLSPTGNAFEFYQFVLTMDAQTAENFYSEGGAIHPDPYAPEWKSAVYYGENYWSAEYEFPLTAFYMTDQNAWSDTWLVNFSRTAVTPNGYRYSAWSQLEIGFLEPKNFKSLSGFPMRPAADDVRMSNAVVEISTKDADGYKGTLTVKTQNSVAGSFVFSSAASEPVEVELKPGENTFTVPCCFAKDGRTQIAMQLTRKADGKEFKRKYPVRVSYEPIKLELTLPEYRGNFYPGQDFSKVVGKIIAGEGTTVTLEGPGIPKQTIALSADGNFAFDTPNFEIGEALLNIENSVATLTKKIRNLAPTGHMMTWISGGNLIVNGKPTLRRNMYAEYYMGGEAFKRKYDADDLHQTKEIHGQSGHMAAGRLIPGSESLSGEATKDAMPSDEMFQKVQAVIDANRGRDFAYYYLNDEPECRAVSPVYTKYLYEYICEQDPYHVILMASRATGDFINCMDWAEAHPYINPQVRDGVRFYGRAINTVGQPVEAIVSQNRPDKCVGFLSTCFAYKGSNKFSDYPNFAEMVCHVWAGMLPGAKSLWPYAYHDLGDRASLYEGTRYVNTTFEALEELILLAKRTELIKNQNVHAVLYELNDEKMFALVNFTTEEQTVTLDGISGTWHHFRRDGMLTGNTFTLKPLEVIVGTSEIKDAGLPTYEETAALIDKLEYERTHGGSLLFDRYLDIPITATVRGSAHKLFDGVRNVVGWYCPGEGDKFYEMDLTKVKPTFSKLVVSGWHIDDMEVKVRNGGELTVPEIAEVKAEEFSMTFLFKAPITPEALRLEFHQKGVELYEIEVF